MLPVFRRKREWLKWLLLLVIVALGVTTVLLFVDTPTGLTGTIGTQEVARVSGEPITAAQFGRYYRQLVDIYRQAYNLQQNDPAALEQLGVGQAALNQLISQYAAYHAAQEMGLSVPPGELVERITEMFQDNGQFVGSERYREILRSNNLTPKEFEDSIRRSLMMEKLREILTDGIAPTPSEIREEYLETVQEVRIDYVMVDPSELLEETASDEELRSYYEENKESFRRPERRQIEFIRAYVSPTQVSVTPEQIEQELEGLPSEEQVHARHILIRAEEDEAAARERAEELLLRVRGGEGFEKLAEQFSEDPGSAVRGGDLGFFGRGQMVPEFEEAAFGLEPGEVSGLVQTPFGFHIIMAIARTDSSSRRPAAEYNARVAEAERQSEKLASELIEELRDGATLEELAAEHSLEVRASDYVDAEGTFTSTGLGVAFTGTVFSLQPGEFTDPQEVMGRQLIARLADTQPSELPGFEEIQEEVAASYEEETGQNLAQEVAFDLHREARAGDSFAELAKAAGLDVINTPFFSRSGGLPDENLRYLTPIQEQAFALPVGGISTPIAYEGKYIVFEVVEKTEIDEEAFSVEEPQIRQQLTQQKRTQFYNAYIDKVVDELRRNEQIEINQSLVDEIVG